MFLYVQLPLRALHGSHEKVISVQAYIISTNFRANKCHEMSATWSVCWHPFQKTLFQSHVKPIRLLDMMLKVGLAAKCVNTTYCACMCQWCAHNTLGSWPPTSIINSAKRGLLSATGFSWDVHLMVPNTLILKCSVANIHVQWSVSIHYYDWWFIWKLKCY